MGETTSSSESNASGYDYLLSMPLWSLTEERIAQLRSELAKNEAQLNDIRHATPADLWKRDLDQLEMHIRQRPHYQLPAAENAQK